MRSQSRLLALMSAIVLLGSVSHSATITGTVKGVDGAPSQGAFVEAQNTKTKITVIVLSDTQGHYRVENLPGGEYRVQIRAVGYRAEPQTGVNLAADQTTSLDFTLQKGVVRWNDTSQYQAKQLWPAARAKDLIFTNCSICHGFQPTLSHRSGCRGSGVLSSPTVRPGLRADEISGGYARVQGNRAAL